MKTMEEGRKYFLLNKAFWEEWKGLVGYQSKERGF